MTDPSRDCTFAKTVDATEKCVRRVLSDLRLWVAEQGASDSTCGSVEIVAAEALNNIVEHAYVGEPLGTIQIKAMVQGSGLVLTLVDQGRALPDLMLPEGRLPNRDVPIENLPEGGFGWFLIGQLTTSMAYQRSDGSNHLEVKFDLRE